MLALVLAWAAWAKARSRGATAAAFAALHLPGPAVLAVAVPAAEAVTAVALVARPAVGAYAALVLLLLFTVVLVGTLAGGRRAPCACFGAGRAGDGAGAADVLRNGLLGGLAVVATGSLHPMRPSAAAALGVGLATAAGLVGVRAARRATAPAARR
jgi:hypothetical protein